MARRTHTGDTRYTPETTTAARARKHVDENEVAIPQEHAADNGIGAAEKMLLGMAPSDAVPSLPRTVRALVPVDSVTVRLDAVRGFLSRNPELRRSVAEEADAAWKRADGNREAFAKAIAERRAQLLSEAQLTTLSTGAPAAIEQVMTELGRYLAEMHGLSGRS